MMRSILFIISCVCLLQVAQAGSQFDDSKRIYKSFPASSDFELEVGNKHGDVTIENWDVDSVSVEVNISVESSKLDRLNSIMNQIDVRFTDHSDYLSVSTEWGSGTNGFRVDVMKIFDNQTVRVDYLIKAPNGIEIEIDNKFGDVNLDDVAGKLKVDLAHGKLNARNISFAKSIDVQYGDINVKSIKEGDVITKFSDVRIGEAGEVNLDVTSGDVEIEFADQLVLKVISGDVEIEEANEVDFSASISDVEIEKLNKKTTAFIRFGSLDIEEISSSFQGITIDGQNTDINLDFQAGIAYLYTVQLEKGKSFLIPSEGNKLDKDNVFDDAHQYEGTFATIPLSGLPASVKVSAKASYVKFGVK